MTRWLGRWLAGWLQGCCLSMAELSPTTSVYVVEPEGYDDHARSLEAGKILGVEGQPPSICDSLQAVAPGNNTFPINRQTLTKGLVVSDREVRAAMKVAFET